MEMIRSALNFSIYFNTINIKAQTKCQDKNPSRQAQENGACMV